MALVKNLRLAALCVCGAAILTPSALAQLSRDGGAIEIVADRGELDDVKRQAVYIGNVDVVQGDARLRAKEVVINYNARQGSEGGGGIGSSVGDIQNIQATGDVYYITAREKVKADRGVYNAKDETINLTGNVRVTNADGVIAGENLKINIQTGRYIMDGGTGGRVRTVIDQSSKEQPIQ